VFGSAGNSQDSTPFPQVRALTLNDVPTRGPLGVTHGPSGGGKGNAVNEQKLLDQAMNRYSQLFTRGRLWIMDRNCPGAPACSPVTHALIRLKSDITLKHVSPVLADGSYMADLSGDGLTVRVRVIEYDITVEGQEIPEMFCLVTELTGIRQYPAPRLAALDKWRWDGSETTLREAKGSLDGAGPGHRADTPLQVPRPGPAGTRRLGRRQRDDP
jgi:hypothetical protein